MVNVWLHAFYMHCHFHRCNSLAQPDLEVVEDGTNVVHNMPVKPRAGILWLDHEETDPDTGCSWFSEKDIVGQATSMHRPTPFRPVDLYGS